MKRFLPWIFIGLVICCFMAIGLHQIRTAGDVPRFDYVNGDLYAQVLPWFIFVRQTVLSGSLPLWTPYQAVGHPFFAEFNFLYPIHWLVLPLNVPVALFAIQTITVVIAVVGMVLYLRYLEVGWPGVTLGSILFAYPVFLNSFLVTPGSTSCWVPIIIWLGHRLLDRPSLKSCAALTAALTLSYLGGFVQYFYYICIIVSVYFLFVMLLCWAKYGSAGSLYRGGLIGLAFVLTGALVSIQLLPAMELSLSSGRSFAHGIGEQASSYGFSASRFFQNYFNKEGVYLYGLQFYWPSGLYYLGGSVLLLPFAFLRKKTRPVALALGASLTYSMLFVLFKYTPGLEILARIPFSDAFRWHGRMLQVNQFMFAALAGMGLSFSWERGLLKAASGKRKSDKAWIFLFLCALGFSYPLIRGSINLLFRSPIYLVTFLPAALSAIVFAISKSNYAPARKWIIASVLTLLTLGTLAVHKDAAILLAYPLILWLCAVLILIAYIDAPPRIRRVGPWVVLALILFDMGTVRFVKTTIPATADISKAPMYSLLEKEMQWVKDNAQYERVLVVPDERTLTIFEPRSYFECNAGDFFRTCNINSYASLCLSRWKNFFIDMIIRPADRDQDEVEKNILFYGMLTGLDSYFFERPQFTGLTSLRYMLSYANYGFGEEKNYEPFWTLRYESDDEPKFYVYENTVALPRAYLANSYLTARDEQESLKKIKEHISTLSHSVILEDGRPTFPSATEPSMPGEVRIEDYDVNDVVLAVEANVPSLVVLTDAYYPGWIAFVDGEKTPIWRANSLFRAVEVSPGNHTVTFKYRPNSLIWGTIISLITLLIITAAVAIEHFRTRGTSWKLAAGLEHVETEVDRPSVRSEPPV